MGITLAKSSGFCFGVDRAVEMVNDLLRKGEKVCTLGPIIHNPQLVEELQQRGARIVASPEEVKSGEVLVTRAHGVPKSIELKIAELGLP
ncbi:MAG: bifunctional 4-hydroxy-3-methylbut-2-enyl diphosphate reductase/30S ribosomal protein S1, partial [Clostridia bacterium]|nr:bifunctional 4-hydroxy-3-methylbut-2-enyl diphosphate reductase/30S ribosomal protein S1 [Clostridia bacterium]